MKLRRLGLIFTVLVLTFALSVGTCFAGVNVKDLTVDKVFSLSYGEYMEASTNSEGVSDEVRKALDFINNAGFYAFGYMHQLLEEKYGTEMKPISEKEMAANYELIKPKLIAEWEKNNGKLNIEKREEVKNENKIEQPVKKVSKAKNTLAAPKISGFSYLDRLIVKWNKVKGAKGYQLKWRCSTKGTKWAENCNLINSVGSKFVVKPKYKGATATYNVFGINKEKKSDRYEFKVRAYKIVKGKKIYSKYSEVYKMEPKVDAKIIHDGMMKYIKKVCPEFEYYNRTGVNGVDEPLTEQNSSWDITWSNEKVWQYADINEVLYGLDARPDGNTGGLTQDIDRSLEAHKKGCPYIKDLGNGNYQVWMVC